METPSRDELLDTFADGELDEAAHADTVEQFREEPECRAYVAGVGRLKGSLASMWSDETPPDTLRMRVRTALDTTDEGLFVEPAPESVFRPGGLGPKHLPILAAAACVLLVVLVWQLWPNPRPQLVRTSSVQAFRVSSAVNAHHALVTSYSEQPEQAVVETSLRQARKALSERLGVPVHAPDLRSRGFVFVGSSPCTIERLPGAQLLYRHGKSGMLSLFTVTRLESLRGGVTGGAVLEVSVSEQPGLTTLAWNQDGASYLACASLPETELLALLGMKELAAQAQLGLPWIDASLSVVMTDHSDYDRPSESPVAAHPVERSRRAAAMAPPSRMVHPYQWIALIRRAIVMG